MDQQDRFRAPPLVLTALRDAFDPSILASLVAPPVVTYPHLYWGLVHHVETGDSVRVAVQRDQVTVLDLRLQGVFAPHTVDRSRAEVDVGVRVSRLLGHLVERRLVLVHLFEDLEARLYLPLELTTLDTWSGPVQRQARNIRDHRSFPNEEIKEEVEYPTLSTTTCCSIPRSRRQSGPATYLDRIEDLQGLGPISSTGTLQTCDRWLDVNQCLLNEGLVANDYIPFEQWWG